ncbi:hypothetical protein HC231_02665 [Brenneria izadpanahii]|uniref:CdiI immunity protein domain-containing protein n=1 Tax=Brenneria izadpanahii TaxID=2722756 RepID=A0ABX7UMZ3_9GAMM|nr:contact-dependent growth inhibition system immunity protein [Brenneria izadpanahii]QTF06958.1 hypothetical protein HC231_02665 [Brenneria izadpanahii]
MKRKYVELDILICVFFGQDSEEFGDSIEEVVNSYVEMESAISVSRARKQIQKLLDDNDDVALKEKLTRLAKADFNPTPSYGSWRNFLTKLKNLLPKD